jgi:hypothetical protein
VTPVQGISSTTDPGSSADYFYYSALAPDVSMVLDLTTGSGSYVVPLVAAGSVDSGTSWSFTYTGAATCSGTSVSVCDPAHVGLVAGAIYSAPVTIDASFPAAATPERGFLVPIGLTILWFAASRLRRRQAA